jgi:hypothetical protein
VAQGRTSVHESRVQAAVRSSIKGSAVRKGVCGILWVKVREQRQGRLRYDHNGKRKANESCKTSKL